MRWAALAGAVVGGLAASACAPLIGLSDGDYAAAEGGATGTELDAGAAVACGIRVASADCQACVASHCCQPATACAANAACAGYEDCLFECGGDYSCRVRCETLHPSQPVPQIPVLDQCMSTSCESSCGLQCGVVTFVGVPPDAAPACARCIAQSPSVCSAAEACAHDAQCVALASCVASCDTLDCQAACSAGQDAAAALESSFLSAAQGACIETCDFGDDWSCVGNATPPLAKAPKVELTARFLDYAMKTAIPGLVVRACHIDDPRCALPVSPPQTTDSDGSVTLPLPLSAASGGYGFAGYLDVTAPVPEDGGSREHVETLEFFSWPLSEPSFALTLYVPGVTDWSDLATLGGVTLDPTLGGFVTLATDCSLIYGRGIQVSASPASPQTRVLYATTSGVSSTLTPAVSTSLAFLLNVPAGPSISLTATPLALGHPSSIKSAFVRPGAVSFVRLDPN